MRAGATSSSTTRPSTTPTTTSGCGGCRCWRNEFPELQDARLAYPEGGRDGLDRVHRRRPPAADGEPRQRLLLRGSRFAARCRARCPTRHCSASRSSTGSRSTSSTKATGSPGASPAATADRRGRHAEPQDDRLGPGPPRPEDAFPVPDLFEVRGEVFPPWGEGFEEMNATPTSRPVRRVPRQSAQRRRRLAPPDRPGRGPSGPGRYTSTATAPRRWRPLGIRAHGRAARI